MSLITIRLIIGLGNPGPKYIGTRHNIGFMVLEELAAKESVQFINSKKLFGKTAEIQSDMQLKRLLMPNTFMNESGRSIKSTMEWHGLKPNQILVIVDDMDLPLGKIRLRTKGGSGGHKGLKSTINHIGTQEFCRLRIGIGSPSRIADERKSKTVNHVLGNFKKDEMIIIKKIIEEVIYGLNLINEKGIDVASNYLNSYSIEE